MEVICLQDEAFYQLIEDVVERLKEKQNIIHDKWISPERAMEVLNIKSKTTLQKLRDKGQANVLILPSCFLKIHEPLEIESRSHSKSQNYGVGKKWFTKKRVIL